MDDRILSRSIERESYGSAIPLQVAMRWVLEDLKNPPPPRPCHICGELTRNEFYRLPICNPYDEQGIKVKDCKYIYRERMGW